MEDGYYIACPRCGKISKGEDWVAEYEEIDAYEITIEDDGNIDFTKAETNEITHLNTIHYCGDDEFYTEEYTPEDFIIKIENGKITEFGIYYSDFIEDLKSVAEKNGLVIELIENNERLVREAINTIFDIDNLRNGYLLVIHDEYGTRYDVRWAGKNEFEILGDNDIYEFEAENNEELAQKIAEYFNENAIRIASITGGDIDG